MTVSSGFSTSIAGLGITEMGRVYGRSNTEFATDAVRLALDDAGLSLSDVDGLLVNSGITPGIGIRTAGVLGLENLGILSDIQQYGSSATAMVQYASMAIEHKMAEVVVCVFSDAPLKEGTSSGSSYSGRRAGHGFSGLAAGAGVVSPNVAYAMAASRHMATYGTTSEQLGAIAVTQRQWAGMNPMAQMRDPITLEDHQNSRWVVEPLHLLDCCLVSNGGVAVVVTSTERAKDLRQPPVQVLGWGQGHPGYRQEAGSQLGLVTGATMSGKTAMGMAGIKPSDVDVAEIYDCYTFTVLVTLEDYGFCAKGEGGEFVASGALGPDGSLPTNTGGGELSAYYMWGMTPLSEAVIQARGQGGDRQVPKHDVVLVSGNGGILDHHGTLILGGAS